MQPRHALYLFLLVTSVIYGTLPAECAVTVNTVNGLVTAVNNANSGGDKTILVAPGTYNLNGAYLQVTSDGVTIKASTGNRDAVILDGAYLTTEIFQIIASNVTISDLTLKRAYYHPIHVIASNSGNVTGTLIDNVHIIDPGQQAIKINQNGAATFSVNYGTVQNSLIELTDSGRTMVWSINGSCYTGGIDAHHATGWQVRGNTIKGFWCADDLSEHGVHFWSDSVNTLVEQNLIADWDRGIGFGLGSRGHQGGIIRNNMIYHGPDHGYSDVGIGLESAPNTQVYNNTIFQQHEYPNAIEYRFSSTTNVYLANNLTNRSLTSRDEASANLYTNVTNAQSDWFINPISGKLHLARNITTVVDKATPITDLLVDFDGETRPIGLAPDIGADEYQKNDTPIVSPLIFPLLRDK